jgi:hypothetical protein
VGRLPEVELHSVSHTGTAASIAKEHAGPGLTAPPLAGCATLCACVPLGCSLVSRAD